MKLTHWVEKEFVEKTLKKEFVILDKQGWLKPTGIWLSIDNNWEDWLEGNWDTWKEGKVCLNIKLAKDIKLFIIENKEQFLQEFKLLTGFDYGFEKDILSGNFEKEDLMFKYNNIDKFHEGLKKKYDGVLLKSAPFWKHRLDMNFDYFYPWDCESICVWNTDKIIEVTK